MRDPTVLAVSIGILAMSLGLPCRSTAGGPVNSSDGDGIPDILDNCVNTPNAGALFCDTDQDGYGNACDADFNNSFTTNLVDFGIFKSSFGQPGQTDLDCSGTTNLVDFGRFKQLFGKQPGPSGLACAGTVPCN